MNKLLFAFGISTFIALITLSLLGIIGISTNMHHKATNPQNITTNKKSHQ